MAHPLTPVMPQGKSGATSIASALDSVRKVPGPYTVAQLNALNAATYAGVIVLCSNGAAGQPCLAYSNGTSFLRVVFGAAVNVAT